VAEAIAPPAPGGALDDLRVYRRLVGAAVRAELQYRRSFALYLVAQFLVMSVDLIAILVLFTNVTELAGWSVDEVLLLYAFGKTAFSVADAFASPLEQAGTYVRAGTFDQFLLKPRGTLLQLCAREFATRRLGRLLQPAIVLALVLPRVSVAWTPAKVVFVPLTLVAGTVLFAAMWVVTGAIAFWTTEIEEVANAFTYGGGLMVSYPVDAFGPWLQRLVVFVVPLAFVAYLPAAWLLGKPSPLGLPSAVGLLTPAVAGLAALVAVTVWRRGIRRYRSTGS
jgi:ABC-2 type transport system permease protein